jgi:hypothetical protein
MDTLAVHPAGINSTVAPGNSDQASTDSMALRQANPNPDPLACSCGATGTNNNFASATTLTVGAGAIAGSTCGATLEAGENLDCNPSANQSVWYKFVATATTSYVVVHLDPSSNCSVGSAIFQTSTLPTGSCPHASSCQSASYGPFSGSNTVYQLPTVIGTTYYVQVVYGSGGPCGNSGCFTINVTNTNPGGITNAPPANSCATATSTCYLSSSAPTAAQITSGCTANNGSIGPNQVYCTWLSFTTQAAPGSTTTNFQGYITSNCALGTIDWFDWTLYDASCSNMITCGNLNTGLSLAGLACSTTYNIEYCFETANCTWTTWYWYFNPPSSPPPCTTLPIELLDFKGEYEKNNHRVALTWKTASEHNNDHFVIERSVDGRNFIPLGQVNTAAPNGNSSQPVYYSFYDNEPVQGTCYYKLRQFDNSGLENYGGMTAVSIDELDLYDLVLQPNPANMSVTMKFSSAGESSAQIRMFDYTGREVKTSEVALNEGVNSIEMPVTDLPDGFYFIQVSTGNTTMSGKLIKR